MSSNLRNWSNFIVFVFCVVFFGSILVGIINADQGNGVFVWSHAFGWWIQGTVVGSILLGIAGLITVGMEIDKKLSILLNEKAKAQMKHDVA